MSWLKRRLPGLFAAGAIPEVDGLRACAVSMVVLTHIFQTIPGLSLVRWNVEWTSPLFSGWMGVDLFLVLSGFLMGSILLRKTRAPNFSFADFYLRRFFRIVPAYYAVLLGVYLVGLSPWGTVIAPEVHMPGALLKNLLFLTDYFPADFGAPSWSLGIEEKFYLLTPLLLWGMRRRSARDLLRVFVFFCLAAFVARAVTYRAYDLGPGTPQLFLFKKIYFPFHVRLDGLGVGLVVAVLTELACVKIPAALASVLRYAGGAMVAYVATAGSLTGGYFQTTFQFTLLAMGFGAILLSYVARESAARSKSWLASPKWVPLARLSYSLYLVQLITIRAGEHFFRDSSAFTRVAWAPAATLAFTLAVALALFALVEYPFHRYAQRKFR